MASIQGLLSGASKHITATDAKHLLHKVMSSEKKISNLKDAGEEVSEMILGTLAGTATSYLLGRREAETGGAEIKGIPEPLAVAGAGFVISMVFSKPGGMMRTLTREVGRAGLYCYSHTSGQAHGLESKKLAASK